MKALISQELHFDNNNLTKFHTLGYWTKILAYQPDFCAINFNNKKNSIV